MDKQKIQEELIELHNRQVGLWVLVGLVFGTPVAVALFCGLWAVAFTAIDLLKANWSF